MAATAAMLRLLRRVGRGASASPPSAMMQSLFFRGSYSPAVVATLPAVHHAAPPVQSQLRRYSSKGPTEDKANELLEMARVHRVIGQNLKNNTHSLLDQIKNFEERDGMLGKQLHKGNAGKESSPDLVL
ncbi:hypothetical protein EJB05_56779, partial [Eragrostis curvula]